MYRFCVFLEITETVLLMDHRRCGLAIGLKLLGVPEPESLVFIDRIQHWSVTNVQIIANSPTVLYFT